MVKHLFRFISKQWKLWVALFILIDFMVVAGLLYIFVVSETERVAAAELSKPTPPPSPALTVTATPWPGPPPTPSRTPTRLPTAQATEVLAESGFPPGFTPTPRPTREAVFISLPYVYPANASAIDVPVINQVYYPEPFFPPGTNNACGPVALYAGLLALGADIDYTHLRDVAVNHGFTHYGISKSGMVNTITTLNHELGSPYTIEHGNNYGLQDLMQSIRRRGVVAVLIRVYKSGSRYYVTADKSNSIGHFLIIDNINLRTGTVKFAGSTLGMDEVPLQDFLQSWASNPQPITEGPAGWRGYIKNDVSENWALIVRHRLPVDN